MDQRKTRNGSCESTQRPGFVLALAAFLILQLLISPASAQSVEALRVTAGFPALEDDNTMIPPDTQGAVGPRHLIVALNSGLRIQDRTGKVISTVSPSAFWQRTGVTDVVSSRVVYDPYGQRWIVTALGDSNASPANSTVLIGVSQTDDPTGAWYLRKIKADPASRRYPNSARVGFNKDWIVVTANMFGIADNAFGGSTIYVFDKASFYASGSGRVALLQDPESDNSPAATYDNSLSLLYLVGTGPNDSGGKGYLRIRAVTGAPGAETLSPARLLAVGTAWSFRSANDEDFAPQLGSTARFHLSDARVQNIVYRNGSIWGTQMIFLPAGGSPTRSGVQWWEVTPDAVRQAGRIEDPSSRIFYAFPSIAVNKKSEVMIGYSKFSAVQYAGAAYSFRHPSDSPGTLRGEGIVKQGEAPYLKTFFGWHNSWGFVSSTVVDPNNDSDMWTVQEYAASPSEGTDRWGTWWSRIGGSNRAPVAEAGPDRSARSGMEVILDGSASHDADSDRLTYQWSQASPADPAVTLLSDGAARARFLVPSVAERTDFVFTLTVSDGQATSSTRVRVCVVPPQSIYFSHFGAGHGVASTLILINPSSTLTAEGTARVFSSTGAPLPLVVNGAAQSSGFTFSVPPLGMQVFKTDGSNAFGSLQLSSNYALGATLLFSGPAGLAGISGTRPSSRFLLPIQSDAAGGVFTGVALASASAVTARLTLRDSRGNPVPEGSIDITLDANGQLAKFPEEIYAGRSLDLSRFQGTLEVNAAQPLAGTAIRVSPGQLATLPIIATGARRLLFPQFGNAPGVGSALTILNPLADRQASVTVRTLDDDGYPLPVTLNGRDQTGSLTFEIAPQGSAALVASPDSSNPALGSVVVDSTEDVGGAVLYGGDFGLEGVGTSDAVASFIAPVEQNAGAGVSTGLAMMNVLASPVTIKLTLRDREGDLVEGGTTTVSLKPRGHIARFLQQYFSKLDLSSFAGTVTAESTGEVGAVVLRQSTTPKEFATFPVTGLIP